jgi:hypothetical protein
MIECPIPTCDISFLNKYSLRNHIIKSADPAHIFYYETRVKEKYCPCGTHLDHRRKFINEEGLCYSCYRKKYPKTQKDIKKRWQIKNCFICHNKVEGLFSDRNTRVLCSSCRRVSRNKKINYNKNWNKIRYEKARKKRTEIRSLKKDQKLKELYILLKKELFETVVPIYQLCNKYHISLLSIRKVLPLIMSDSEYRKRNHQIRSRAVQLRIDDLKNYLKNRPESRKLIRTPTSIEKIIGEKIKEIFPEAEIRFNIWKTLKDEDNNCYLHLESDVIINFGGIRIIVLSDGEAFHGKDSYFNGNTIAEDDRRSQILHKYNPYVIRYSETEIKKGFAIAHLERAIRKILSREIVTYYRNWMTNIEDVNGI